MALATPSGELENLVDATSGKEIIATPTVVDRFADLKKKYEQYLIIQNDLEQWVKDHVKEVFLPPDINIFVQQTREYENYANYNRGTSDFISQLIQNSYKAGNNGFELDMNLLKPIDDLASGVYGTKKRMVRVVVKGEASNYCGFQAKKSAFTIEKAGNWCGWSAKHSTFTIGEAGDKCGFRAENSTFTIEKAGDNCGSEAHQSTFKTHNPNQYERFKKFVHPSKDNKLYLLATDDSIIKGVEW